MTTISAHRSISRTTPFERTLLRTAATLDVFVAVRLERRSGAVHRRAVDAQIAYADGRRVAHALGAIGLMPR